MVTKLCAGKPRGADTSLPVWLFLKFSGLPVERLICGFSGGNKFEACELPGYYDVRGGSRRSLTIWLDAVKKNSSVL